MLKNLSNFKIYARLSSEDKVDSILKEVDKYTSVKWIRNNGFKFHLQIERTNQIKKGPIYEVKLGETYVLDYLNHFKTEKGEEIKLSGDKFGEKLKDENNKKNSEDTKNPRKNILKKMNMFKNINLMGSVNLANFDKLAKLHLTNTSNKDIKAKILGDKDAQYTLIKSNTSGVIRVKFGKHVMQIEYTENEENINAKFIVNSEYSYTFNSGLKLILDINNKEVSEINAGSYSFLKNVMQNGSQAFEKNLDLGSILVGKLLCY